MKNDVSAKYLPVFRRGQASRQNCRHVDMIYDLFSTNNQRTSMAATRAAASWARMKAGACAGKMPEKLSVKERAIVTAGLAKLVDDVNQ